MQRTLNEVCNASCIIVPGANMIFIVDLGAISIRGSYTKHPGYNRFFDVRKTSICQCHNDQRVRTYHLWSHTSEIFYFAINPNQIPSRKSSAGNRLPNGETLLMKTESKHTSPAAELKKTKNQWAPSKLRCYKSNFQTRAAPRPTLFQKLKTWRTVLLKIIRNAKSIIMFMTLEAGEVRCGVGCPDVEEPSYSDL